MRARAVTVLLIAAAVPFLGALAGGYVYDDVLLIVRNAAVREGELWRLLSSPLYGDKSPYWRPLTSLLLALGHQLGGALATHGLALLLHLGNALLAYRLLRSQVSHPHAALLLALLFAWHPVQVESVAWCAAINDPLSSLFNLLAMTALSSHPSAVRRKACWPAIWLLAALLAKENALAMLPVLWLCAAQIDDARQRAQTRWWLLAAVVLWWLLRMLVFHEAFGGLARSAAAPASAHEQLLTPAILLAEHLRLLVWPAALTPLHELPHRSQATGWVLTAMVGLAVWLLGRRWRTFSPDRRLGFALLLPLLPTVLLWRSVGAHPIGERYLYLPVLGVLLLSAPMWNGSRRWGLVPIAIAFGLLSAAQTRTWHSDATLAAQGLAAAPTAVRPHLLAGQQALQRAQTGEAQAMEQARLHFQTAQSFAAAHGTRASVAQAEALLGLAWCELLQAKQPTEAHVAAFQRAIAMDPHNASAYVGLGVVHGMANRGQLAEQAFHKALQVDAHHSEAWCNLGYLRIQQGQRVEAQQALRAALNADPGNARAAQLLGSLR